MSKALAILFTGAGASTVAVGGVALKQGWGKGKSEDKPGTVSESPQQGSRESSHTSHPTTTPQPASETFIDTLEKFKSQKKDKCLKELFKDIDFTSTEDTSNVESSFFGSADSAADDKTKGCLSIKWETKKDSDSKWSGAFTWSWAFMNDKKGFIVFTVAKTNESQGLDLTGGAYLLAKEGSEGSETWQVKHKKEITDSNKKSITSSDFASKFPKAKANSQIKENNQDYWGFVDNGTSFPDTCPTEGECNKSPDSKNWSWSWQKGGNDKVSEWSEDLEWWDTVYEKSFVDWETQLSSFTGIWTKDSPNKES